MTDLWSFLLQTLTAAGCAAVLLLVKALFRDKLSPRWQFGIWAVLGLVLLLPAGWGGRGALFPWPLWLETAKTALTGSYSLTRVLAPIPLPPFAPIESIYDILYYVYFLGVLFFLLRYALSYLCLRLALRRGSPGDGAQVERVAKTYGLRPCRAVEVPGLPSAFLCGVFRPVLALPAGVALDDKVILHELLHLDHHDALWGMLTCLLRCVHWCDPLLWWCADRVGGDAEALCDQRVLERLQGEERRDYGRILLSMADEQYARAPGTSSLSNGGKQIARRIASIARFKRYPRGMALVSVCAAAILCAGCLTGIRPAGAAEFPQGPSAAMAYARTRRCSTVAGAVDVYAKSLLTGDGYALAMVTPIRQHAGLAARLEAEGQPESPLDTGEPDFFTGAMYAVYNLVEEAPDRYTGLLVFPNQGDNAYDFYLQPIQVAKGDGWEVLPGRGYPLRSEESAFGVTYGNTGLPWLTYSGEAGGYRAEVKFQYVLSTVTGNSGSLFGAYTDPLPLPDVQFTFQNRSIYGGVYPLDQEEGAAGSVACVPLSASELRRDGAGRTYGPYWDSALPQSLWEAGSQGGGMEPGLDRAPAGFRITFTDAQGGGHTLLVTVQEGGAA